MITVQTAARVTAISGAGRTIGAAVDAFLSVPRPDTTARTYAGTLGRLAARLGRDQPLVGVTDDELAGAANALWGHLEPRTWNRHVATVRSFTSWCRDHGWPAGNLHLSAGRRGAPLLMAISGHRQLATLQQYVKPSQDAVAKLMADTDPDRRRR